MNLGDDEALLSLMKDAEFKSVFMGIETPDVDLLEMTQKSQNTVKPIVERVRKVYEYGIFVSGGFIMPDEDETFVFSCAEAKSLEVQGCKK